MSDKTTRRVFLGSTAPAALGTGMLAREMLAAPKGPIGANGDLSVGLIGCGGRGHYVSYVFSIVPGARVTAICDVNRKRMEKVHQEVAPDAAMHHDYREIVGDKDIDAVIVATNGHWHVLPTIEACAAGKDVYLEKPVGTSIGEGRAAVEAARKHKRIVQMGTQQKSWEHYHQAVEVIRSGVLGEISLVEVFDLENDSPGWGSPPDGPPPPELDWDLWLGPSPKVPYNPNRYAHHYWFFDYGGSWQLDWAVHHYDIVHWAMGVDTPVAATGVGGHFAMRDDNREWPDTFMGTAEYPAGPVSKKGFLMTFVLRGGCNRGIERRTHGKVFYGTEGALALDRGGFEVYPQVREGKTPIAEQTVKSSRPEHEVVQEHVKAFIASVRSRKQPFANLEVGHHSSNPGHLMNVAWRVGRRIRWDSQKERVIDDPQANRWLTKAYRAPWALPLQA